MSESLRLITLSGLDQAQNAKVKSLHSELVPFFEYILELVYREKNPNMLSKLLALDLCKPFPYCDTSKIMSDFKELILEEDCINADLNTYWMNINGNLSYILRGRSQKIPQDQRDWLNMSFFDLFQQYSFLEEHIGLYPGFYEEYINYEKARIFIFCYLFLEAL
ncbi:YxiJ family protein [Psychrobacillus psychrodurans]|uniref:YxiJ-like family protein n=1 Tax=Psychrobacillus psychrodurans TaxID=126157 RepID=A0A9X3RCD7_9BACI|nr:YxiJ family protein [Psychrobacillus psychrodurans]MCZ8535293.1 YxiJ-like family protein [Psychrobacillus psychrodurans]